MKLKDYGGYIVPTSWFYRYSSQLHITADSESYRVEVQGTRYHVVGVYPKWLDADNGTAIAMVAELLCGARIPQELECEVRRPVLLTCGRYHILPGVLADSATRRAWLIHRNEMGELPYADFERLLTPVTGKWEALGLERKWLYVFPAMGKPISLEYYRLHDAVAMERLVELGAAPLLNETYLLNGVVFGPGDFR